MHKSGGKTNALEGTKPQTIASCTHARGSGQEWACTFWEAHAHKSMQNKSGLFMTSANKKVA
jgi:hypothetical protein